MTLVLALLLDAAFGEPAWLWSRLTHPAVATGNMIGWLDRTLNTRDSDRAGRAKGLVVVSVLVIGSIFAGLLIATLGVVAEIALAAILIAQKSLVQHVRTVATALRHSVADGRDAVAHIVSRDCSAMSRAQVSRAAIESASENLSDGVIAPIFWFAIAGLPGLLVYKSINTADSMIGYRNSRYAEFGWASARLDDLLNLIPARLTGLIIAALSGQLHAWSAITTDARAHRSPNAGWPEAAMARALNIALAGPRSYDGWIQSLPWVNGDAARDIGPDEIDASVDMLWRVWRAVLILAIASAAIQTLF